jgi:hypothetical protein
VVRTKIHPEQEVARLTEYGGAASPEQGSTGTGAAQGEARSSSTARPGLGGAGGTRTFLHGLSKDCLLARGGREAAIEKWAEIKAKRGGGTGMEQVGRERIK